MQHGVLIIIVLWKLWCARNAAVFENKQIQAFGIIAQALNLHQYSLQAFHAGGAGARLRTLPREVSWEKPALGYVALNVDGSAITNSGLAGFGGLIRDHTGMFLGGFYGSVGHSNILHAELLALFHGISLCWEKGFKKVVCYTDSLLALKLILEGDPNFHMYGNELALLKKLLSRDWDIQLHHILREGNQCADFLAKMGARSNVHSVMNGDAPADMERLLLADALGISFLRP